MPASFPTHSYQLICCCVLILGNGLSVLSLPCCGVNNKGLGKEAVAMQSVGIICCCRRIIRFYGLLLTARLLLMLPWHSLGPWPLSHDVAWIFWWSSNGPRLVFMLVVHVADVATPGPKTGLTSRGSTAISDPLLCHLMHYWKNKEISLMSGTQ